MFVIAPQRTNSLRRTSTAPFGGGSDGSGLKVPVLTVLIPITGYYSLSCEHRLCSVITLKDDSEGNVFRRVLISVGCRGPVLSFYSHSLTFSVLLYAQEMHKA